MHVIALENEPSSSRGGQELNLFEICRGLSQRGHKVSLLYVREGNLLEQYRNFCESILKVNSYGFDVSEIIDNLDFFASIPVVWKLPKHEDSLVFCNDYYAVFFARILASLKKIPLVCYLQIPPIAFPYGFNIQKRIGLKGVNQFIAVSNQTKLDWVNIGIKEDIIDVVYNGTNAEKFKPTANFSTIRKEWNIPENIRVISYAGRLDKMKGLETLIKAFSLVRKSGNNARLLIAGKPVVHSSPEEGEEYKRSLKQLVTDLGVEKYVDFIGHITNTTSLYQVSDVTVLPSLWSEPFGRSIIESMACGTPVVASRIGGIPENLTGEFENGLFEAGNEQDFSETLNRIMNWRDTDPQLGQRCRQHILDKFTLDKLVDGMEKVLLKVAQR